MSNWDQLIQRANWRAEKHLLSFNMLRDCLEAAAKASDSLIEKVEFEFDAKRLKNKFIIGGTRNDRPSEDPDYVQTVELNGLRHKNVKIKIWTSKLAVFKDDHFKNNVVREIIKIFHAWWNPESRSGKGDLLLWSEKTKIRGDQTLDNQIKIGGPFSVIFCDLDRFKVVNTKLGQKGGDEVIARVADFLEGIASDAASVIHHGGDEFVIVLPEAEESETVALCSRIGLAAKEFDFGAGTIPIKFSFGIASSRVLPGLTFDKLTNWADSEILKKIVKNNTRVKGAMRFARPAESQTFSNYETQNISHIPLIIRSKILEEQPPFASVWLNALVRIGRNNIKVTKSPESACVEVLRGFESFKLKFSSRHQSCISRGVGVNYDAGISKIDLLAACARVVVEAIASMIIKPKAGNLVFEINRSAFQLKLGQKIFLKLKQEKFRLGNLKASWGSPIFTHKVKGVVNSSPFILIEIGRNNYSVLPHICADHIVIDDRPAKGGGLPDFWELALSRLFSKLHQLPNVEKILIVGDVRNGKHIVEKIDDVTKWDLDDLADKTAVSKDLVRYAKRRIVGNTYICNSESEAVSKVVTLIDGIRRLKEDVEVSGDSESRLMRRLLADDKDGHKFGYCQALTAAEAFPKMLEIIRYDSIGEEINDQDGQRLREIVDYKVKLDSPLERCVPSYYLKQKDLLDAYFRREFIEKSGRFKAHLAAAEDSVVEHVCWALTRKEGAFSTRRAILIIPHAVSTDKPERLSPLGLVSVRIIPRPGVDMRQPVISFSISWRTVEALVGFPYSLYGSIKYSEFLFEKIKHKSGLLCKFGSISYIAHSLHFSICKESYEIARKIVNESSG